MFQNRTKWSKWNKNCFNLNTESNWIIASPFWNPFRTRLTITGLVLLEKWKCKSVKKVTLHLWIILKRIFSSIYNTTLHKNASRNKNITAQSIFHTWWLFNPKMKILLISTKEYRKCKKSKEISKLLGRQIYKG